MFWAQRRASSRTCRYKVLEALLEALQYLVAACSGPSENHVSSVYPIVEDVDSTAGSNPPVVRRNIQATILFMLCRCTMPPTHAPPLRTPSFPHSNSVCVLSHTNYPPTPTYTCTHTHSGPGSYLQNNVTKARGADAASPSVTESRAHSIPIRRGWRGGQCYGLFRQP